MADQIRKLWWLVRYAYAMCRAFRFRMSPWTGWYFARAHVENLGPEAFEDEPRDAVMEELSYWDHDE